MGTPVRDHTGVGSGWISGRRRGALAQESKQLSNTKVAKRHDEKRSEPMSLNELQGYRKTLTARVSELKRITGQRDGITIERSAELLEEVQSASERALAVGHLDRDYSQLRNALAALGRIEDGSFGICQRCDEDIHPKRLAALPWAAFCIRCQEAVDRNEEEVFEMPVRELLARAA
jgi:DnaK suppressor protein